MCSYRFYKIAEIHIEYVKNNFKTQQSYQEKKTKAKHFANLMKNKFNIKFNYSNHKIFKILIFILLKYLQ